MDASRPSNENKTLSTVTVRYCVASRTTAFTPYEYLAMKRVSIEHADVIGVT
jgi:hypothetical protein